MSYYRATDLIKQAGESTGIIRTITHGSFGDIDVKRQTIPPLMHVTPTTLAYNGPTETYGFNILFLDLIDFNKEDLYDEPNPYRGTDNLMDVFHAMRLAGGIFVDQLTRGRNIPSDITIAIGTSGNFVSNKTENMLSGIELTITITLPGASATDGIC